MNLSVLYLVLQKPKKKIKNLTKKLSPTYKKDIKKIVCQF